MRRITALLLSFVLTAGVLTACGQEQPEVVETTAPTETVQEPATESTEEAAEPRGYYLAEDYLADPDLFVPAWQGQWEVPEAMLDWEEKFQSFYTPDGRTMSIAHRGDRNVLYPENSIEGFLSAIYAGADIVEVDVIKTKDGIPIVFHDEDLLRTTNLTLMRLDGEAGHLPASNKVADWTLAEIRELRLVMETGELTNYVVPTLEDLLMVAKDRVFVTLDKFRRIDWNLDIVPLIEKVGCYETVLIPYTYARDLGFTTTGFYMKRLENAGAREVGMTCIVTADTIAQVAADIIANDFPMAMRCGEYKPGNAAYAATYLPYAGQYRMFFETLERTNDNVEVWSEMDEYGFNVIMCNTNIYDLTRFIADRYFS